MPRSPPPKPPKPPGISLRLPLPASLARQTAVLTRRAAMLAACYFLVFQGGAQLILRGADALAHAAIFALIAFSTFLSCAMLAMDVTRAAVYDQSPASVVETSATIAHLPTIAPHSAQVIRSRARFDSAPVADKLERLVSARPPRRAKSSSGIGAVITLPNRRPVLDKLKVSTPAITVVPPIERRRRSSASLAEADIRIANARATMLPGARKPQDVYVVHVDCASPPDAKSKEKLEQPAWDVTATFEQFKALERALKREVRAKRLTASARAVPHLSSGAVLFVQPEIDDRVLSERRQKLQAFVDAIRSNRVLAQSQSLRMFCHAC